MNMISACLVVRNEEKLIARCLDSLRGAVDEIIVVHDGPCSDRTLSIAATYGAKTFTRPFYGVAEGQRPFSYEQASGEWILQIDADEFLSDNLRNRLRSLTSAKEISAYKFIWPIWNAKKNLPGSWPEKIALMRKDAVTMWGIPHFVPRIKGRVVKINDYLYHQPLITSFTVKNFFQKQLPWARLQANCYLKNFSDIIKYNEAGLGWPRTIKYRTRIPLILIPLEFVWTFIRNIMGGAYRAGMLGIKNAFLLSCYRASVNYYIFKAKRSAGSLNSRQN